MNQNIDLSIDSIKDEILHALDVPIISRRYANVFTNPDYAFHGAFVTRVTRHSTQEIRSSIWSGKIEYPNFFLLATSQKMFGVWRKGDTADNVVVWKRVKCVARIRIP